ncbi:class I adenylate-forming enzyme family protein [Neorhizobium sp. AL 9.2.2]|uniref:class I adenylate-forming enzyme family protein n=1 Tax=Neorhizobium sp. AL 9.2.2 TaxID=2712894 RepID=UPI00157462DD|nr:class I adenylate-forming enzyme family protein [Neorhizobium sp. AL 9.2.2]NSY18455.1 acyl--CoA ligase [Neorhizobium sp. AL 9.2.2]
MNLAEAIEVNAKGRPDHVALIEKGRQLTYRELADEVRLSAGRLTAKGVSAGDVVGLCLGDTIDHMVFIYAIARIGAVILPMDVRWTDAEKTRLVEHFGARLVIAEEGAAPLGAIETLAIADLPPASEMQDKEVFQAVEIPLLLSLSSGTTGRPKGPRISHYQMLRRFWTHWINLGLNSTDRYVSATPLYFGGGRTFAMSVLFAGGTVILFPPPFDASELCAELLRVSATSTFLVPTQIRKLLIHDSDGLDPVRALRLLISSGAPLDADERVAIDALCVNFIEYYASTEGGGVSIGTRDTRLLQPNSVGRPVFGVDVEVVDEDHLPLPPDMIGRLRYRGPGVASGYFNEADVGQDTFRDGWFYPGDLAEIDVAGHVLLRGRSKDLIIRGGINIYPGEIEMILREHPAISEAAVVGWPSSRLGEEIAAFVVAPAPIDEADLRAWCAERLAPYKLPKTFLQIGDLPRNSAGKVLKVSLASKLQPL